MKIKVVTKTIATSELPDDGNGNVQIGESIAAPRGYQVVGGYREQAMDNLNLPVWYEGVTLNFDNNNEPYTIYAFGTFAFPKPASGVDTVTLRAICIPISEVEYDVP